MTERFVIEGVDLADGSRTEMESFADSGSAREWLKRYVRRENAGGWDLIEIYDTLGDPERVAAWERPDAT